MARLRLANGDIINSTTKKIITKKQQNIKNNKKEHRYKINYNKNRLHIHDIILQNKLYNKGCDLYFGHSVEQQL